MRAGIAIFLVALVTSGCGSAYRFSVAQLGVDRQGALEETADDYVRVEAYIDETGFTRGSTAEALDKTDLSLTATLTRGDQQLEVPLYFRSSNAAYTTSSAVVVPWTRSRIAEDMSIEIRAIAAGKGFAPRVSSSVGNVMSVINGTPFLGALAQLTPVTHADKVTRLIAAETKDTLIGRYDLRLQDALRPPHARTLIAYSVIGHEKGRAPNAAIPATASLQWRPGSDPGLYLAEGARAELPLLVLVVTRSPMLDHPRLPSNGLSCETLSAASIADWTSELNQIGDWLTHAQRDAEHQLLALYRVVLEPRGATDEAAVAGLLEITRRRPAADTAFPDLAQQARLCALRRFEAAATSAAPRVAAALEALHALRGADPDERETTDVLRALNRYRVWAEADPVGAQLATFNERVRQTAERLEAPRVQRTERLVEAAAGLPADSLPGAVREVSEDPYLCLACQALVRRSIAARDSARQRARFVADSTAAMERLRSVPESQLVKRVARTLLDAGPPADSAWDAHALLEAIAATPEYDGIVLVLDGDPVARLDLIEGEAVDVSIAGILEDSVLSYDHFSVWENQGGGVVAMSRLAPVGGGGEVESATLIRGPSSVRLAALAPGEARVRVGVGRHELTARVRVSAAPEEEGAGPPPEEEQAVPVPAEADPPPPQVGHTRSTTLP